MTKESWRYVYKGVEVVKIIETSTPLYVWDNKAYSLLLYPELDEETVKQMNEAKVILVTSPPFYSPNSYRYCIIPHDSKSATNFEKFYDKEYE